MVTFRNNNNRRNSFRRITRNFKPNGENSNKFGSNFSNNDNFKRKSPGRNNHNAPKLIEKYNDLAREAQSNGDKILSENYLQNADHFKRILNERDSFKRDKFSLDSTENNSNVVEENSESYNKSSDNDTSQEQTKTEELKNLK